MNSWTSGAANKAGSLDASGDHDIRAVPQRFDNRFNAEIRVGRDDLAVEIRHPSLALDQRKIAADDLVHHIVAVHSGDLQPRNAMLLGNGCNSFRRALRVRRAHVGDDLDAALVARRQHCIEAIDQQWIETGFHILAARLLRERDGAFREAFEREILNVAALGQFERGLDPIPREARSRPYSDFFHVVTARYFAALQAKGYLPTSTLNID